MARIKKKVHTKFVNIGFYGEGYSEEARTFKDAIEIDGVRHKFICDHEQTENGYRFGRWVKEVDYIGV